MSTAIEKIIVKGHVQIIYKHRTQIFGVFLSIMSLVIKEIKNVNIYNFSCIKLAI